MNTAEPSLIQEVASDHAPATTDGNLSGPERYWPRLLRAVTLVFVGVTLHLWIDGPLPSLRIEAPGAGRLSDRWVDARSAPVRQPRVLRAPQAGEALPTVPIEPRFPVAASDVFAAQVEHRRDKNAHLPDGPKYRRIASVHAPAREILRTGGLPDVPDAELPAQPAAHRFSGWAGEAVALAPVAVPAPAAPEARNPAAAAAPAAASSAASSAAPVARAVLVAPRREEESILLVLHEYESAVGRKDPVAAKAVWPALDDRALARAFNDLQSHSLALEDCGVTVATSNAAARARCQGVATYLPKVGRRKPINASHEWTFNLSKTGGDWQIESAAIR
jgi:hypothetical protein